MAVAANRAGAPAERKPPLEITDPKPFERPEDFWRAAAQAATIVMCVLLFGTFLYVARPLLLPVLSAIVVGMTFGPVISL